MAFYEDLLTELGDVAPAVISVGSFPSTVFGS
jgi:hypothetical protein